MKHAALAADKLKTVCRAELSQLVRQRVAHLIEPRAHGFKLLNPLRAQLRAVQNHCRERSAIDGRIGKRAGDKTDDTGGGEPPYRARVRLNARAKTLIGNIDKRDEFTLPDHLHNALPLRIA